jgi:hypothetical protein
MSVRLDLALKTVPANAGAPSFGRVGRMLATPNAPRT